MLYFHLIATLIKGNINYDVEIVGQYFLWIDSIEFQTRLCKKMIQSIPRSVIALIQNYFIKVIWDESNLFPLLSASIGCKHFYIWYLTHIKYNFLAFPRPLLPKETFFISFLNLIITFKYVPTNILVFSG